MDPLPTIASPMSDALCKYLEDHPHRHLKEIVDYIWAKHQKAQQSSHSATNPSIADTFKEDSTSRGTGAEVGSSRLLLPPRCQVQVVQLCSR